MEYLNNYLALLWRMFEFDITVLSQPWMYYILLLPAIGYIVFFFAKWAVLTTPLWLPIFLALQPLRRAYIRVTRRIEKRANS